MKQLRYPSVSVHSFFALTTGKMYAAEMHDYKIGESGFDSWQRARRNLQTSSGAHPAFHPVDASLVPGVKWPGCVADDDLTPYRAEINRVDLCFHFHIYFMVPFLIKHRDNFMRNLPFCVGFKM